MTATRPEHSLYFDRVHIEGELVAGTDQSLVVSVPSEWHTNATIAANPADPNNLIAAWGSKFDLSDPATPTNAPYQRVSVSYSVDGGVSWITSALPVGSGTDLADPVLAFGPDEVAYLLAVEGTGASAHVFRSADKGATWTAAKALPDEVAFPWLACDPSRAGRLYVSTGIFRLLGDPIHGHVLGTVVWRSDDSGETWNAGTVLRDEKGSDLPAIAPHVSVADDGTVDIVYEYDTAIWHCRSIDFGETFMVQRAAGPLSLSKLSLVPSDPWVSGCATGGRFVVSWADSREGVSRVYYRATDEDGLTWVGPDGGTPLLLGPPTTSGAHHIRPRLAATAEGTVGCAFYELTQVPGRQSLTMMLTASRRLEDGFSPPVAVSDAPWTPASAPESLYGVSSSKLFVSHYFGLAADASSFLVLWPQAPAGPVPKPPRLSEDIWVSRPGGEVFVIRIRGGKVVDFVRIPRPSPVRGSLSDVERALHTLAADDSVNAGKRVTEPHEARALGRILRDVAVLLEATDLSEQRALKR